MTEIISDQVTIIVLVIDNDFWWLLIKAVGYAVHEVPATSSLN